MDCQELVLVRPSPREALVKVVRFIRDEVKLPIVAEPHGGEAALEAPPDRPWKIIYTPDALTDGDLAVALLHEAGHAVTFRRDSRFYDDVMPALRRFNMSRALPSWMNYHLDVSHFLTLENRKILYMSEVKAWRVALDFERELRLGRFCQAVQQARSCLFGYECALQLDAAVDGLPPVV